VRHQTGGDRGDNFQLHSHRQIDAAALIHSQAYRALQSGEFVSIFEPASAERRVRPLVSAVNVSYPEKLSERRKRFRISSHDQTSLPMRSTIAAEFRGVGKRSQYRPKFFDVV